MWPAIRNLWLNFMENEAYFIARVRALVMVLAASGGFFGHDIAAAANAPGLEKPFKIAAVICAGLALYMRAGDKTPEEVKDMAVKMREGG